MAECKRQSFFPFRVLYDIYYIGRTPEHSLAKDRCSINISFLFLPIFSFCKWTVYITTFPFCSLFQLPLLQGPWDFFTVTKKRGGIRSYINSYRICTTMLSPLNCILSPISNCRRENFNLMLGISGIRMKLEDLFWEEKGALHTGS